VTVRLAALAALTLALAGCGGGDEPVATPAPANSGANAYIGSIAVDPGDGTVMLGTGLGLFRLDKGAKDAERVTGQLRTPDGAGQVSSNLVVRYAGPGELLASGHPESAGLPENLGLMRSRDRGDIWKPVALLGSADFHILQAGGSRIVAVNADAKEIQISADGGRTFAKKTPPDVPLDVVFDPRDPTRMVVATKLGLFTSLDGGDSWRQRDPTPSEQLAWGKPGALYRADPGGAIKRSRDGGATWHDAGNVGATRVSELAVDAAGALYTSVAGGQVKRSTDGGATWTVLVTLE
jgi:hypothetical protein